MDATKLSLFLIITLFIQIRSYALPHPEPLNIKTHKFNQYDIRIGNILKEPLKNSSSQLSIRNIRWIKRNYKKSKLFRRHHKVINSILAAKQTSSPLQALKICERIDIQTDIALKLQRWCYKHSISSFVAITSKQRLRISKRNMSSFIKLIAKNEPNLLALLKKSKRSHRSFKRVGNTYSQYIISNNLQISPHVKRHLYINSDFADFIKFEAKRESTETDYANKLFKQIYGEYKKSSREKDFTKLQSISNQMLSLFKEYRPDISSSSHYMLVNVGKSFSRSNYTNQAKYYFKSLYQLTRNSEPKQRDLFLFNYLWSYLQHEDYTGTLEQIYKAELLDNLDSYSTQIKFWIAYTFQKNDEYKIAHYIYSKIISENPLDYYSIMADSLLKYNKYSFVRKLVNSNSKSKTKPAIKLSRAIRQQIDEASLLHYIGCHRIAIQQIKKLLSEHSPLMQARVPAALSNKKAAILDNILTFLKDQKLFLPLFQTVFSNASSIHQTTLQGLVKYLFPFEYYANIKQQTKKVNPIVILSLIRQESSFNPYAKSTPGAKGLMQLMPQTATEMKISHLNNIYKPKENIKIGIKYFEHLMDRFDNNLIYSLAAYNAGPTRVSKWISNIFTNSNPLITIENIPYKETRKYVKLIYRNIFFYNLLLEIKKM